MKAFQLGAGLVLVATTLAAPALAIEPRYATLGGDDCLDKQRNEIVRCTKAMRDEIDAALPTAAVRWRPRAACYAPANVTDCPHRWGGSTGGGRGMADNCHNLPDCPR